MNKVIIKNKYMLPWINDMFDQIKGAKVFWNINLRSRYHQVKIKDENVHKTTFRMQYRNYEFTVVSFGLTYVPTTFMCLMKNIFSQYLNKSILVF